MADGMPTRFEPFDSPPDPALADVLRYYDTLETDPDRHDATKSVGTSYRLAATS